MLGSRFSWSVHHFRYFVLSCAKSLIFLRQQQERTLSWHGLMLRPHWVRQLHSSTPTTSFCGIKVLPRQTEDHAEPLEWCTRDNVSLNWGGVFPIKLQASKECRASGDVVDPSRQVGSLLQQLRPPRLHPVHVHGVKQVGHGEVVPSHILGALR